MLTRRHSPLTVYTALVCSLVAVSTVTAIKQAPASPRGTCRGGGN
jgi:hypothetical protein